MANPLLHALIAAFGLDLATDFLWGTANVNLIVFVVTFTVVLVASVRLQRRSVRHALFRVPLGSGVSLDRDGRRLVEILAPVAPEHDWPWEVTPSRERLWARPLGAGQTPA